MWLRVPGLTLPGLTLVRPAPPLPLRTDGSVSAAQEARSIDRRATGPVSRYGALIETVSVQAKTCCPQIELLDWKNLKGPRISGLGPVAFPSRAGGIVDYNHQPPAGGLSSTEGQTRREARPVTVILDQFIHALAESGLMSAEDVRDFLDGLPPEEQPGDGKALAKLLFRRKKLTKFQLQAVYQGKTKGLVIGNYHVLDKIGRGGMGHVYKARHKRMKRVVALKVLPSAMTKTQDAVQRFEREIEAVARLEHPNIVTAHDADEANGVHFLVMQHVKGSDLAVLIRSKGPLSVRKALDYVIQAAYGLEYAHAQGVIHRDIKPSNLLRDHQGKIKILDMGLARLEQEAVSETSVGAPSLTQSGQVMGTVDYMPPEQSMDTHKVDHRADIYSLGCTLFYLLTGRPVFSGDTLAKKIIAHREQPLPSLAILRPDVPPQLDALFQKMLAKQPEDRPSTMSDVLAELESCRTALEEGVEETITYKGDAADSDTTGTQLDLTFDRRGDDAALDHWLQEKLPSTPTHFVSKPAQQAQLNRQQIIAGSIVAGICFLLLLCGAVLLLRTPSGTLVVTVNEPDAEISIDDDDVTLGSLDRTPFEIEIAAGAHTLKVTKMGFEPYTQSVSVKSGQREVFDVNLTPLASGPTEKEKPEVESVTAEAGKSTAKPSPPAVDVVSITRRATLHDFPDQITSIAFGAKGRRLTSNGNGRGVLAVWNVADAELVQRQRAHDARVRCVALGKSIAGPNPGDGNYPQVAAGTYQRATIWTVDVGMRHTYRTDDNVWSVAFTPDGKLLATGDGKGALFLWDALSATLLWQTPTPTPKSMEFSPDGTLLFTGGDGTIIRLWDVATGDEQGRLLGHKSHVLSIDLSADGQTLASASADQTLRFWSVAARQELFAIDHPDEVLAVSLSPNASVIATGCRDGKVRLWSSHDQKLLEELDGHTGPVGCVAFSPQGDILATVGQDKTIMLWDVRIECHASRTIHADAHASLPAVSDTTITMVNDN